jgi:hypothetical protein
MNSRHFGHERGIFVAADPQSMVFAHTPSSSRNGPDIWAPGDSQLTADDAPGILEEEHEVHRITR